MHIKHIVYGHSQGVGVTACRIYIQQLSDCEAEEEIAGKKTEAIVITSVKHINGGMRLSA